MKKKLFKHDFDDIPLSDVITKINIGMDKKLNAYVVTPNVDHVVRNHNSNKLLSIYNSAFLVLNDSRIIKLLSVFLPKRKKLLNVNAGSDLTYYLLETLCSNDITILIIGGGVDDLTVLQEKYSCLNIYQIIPSMTFINDDNEIMDIVDKTRAINPSISFLCVSSPKQELLAKRLQEECTGGIMLCVGAAIDFITGKQKRASKFMQKLSLEWLARLVQNPQKMYRRYLIRGPKIFIIYLKELFNF